MHPPLIASIEENRVALTAGHSKIKSVVDLDQKSFH